MFFLNSHKKSKKKLMFFFNSYKKSQKHKCFFQNSHSAVSETAVIGIPHDIKGETAIAFSILKNNVDPAEEVTVRAQLIQNVRNGLAKFAAPDKIYFVQGLPKTRSGKIMRRILRKISANEIDSIGDTTTLADPSVVEAIIKKGK